MQNNIERIIFDSIAELNKVAQGEGLDLSLEEKFISEGSKLDSLDILTFIVILEAELSSKASIQIDFLSEVGSGANRENFNNFMSLKGFIEQRG